MALVTTVESIDNLDVEVRKVKKVTVLAGNTVSRGDLVRFDDTATTKVVPFATGKVPYTVMVEDVDASAGDVVGLAYRDADIKASEVNFFDGTDAEVRDALDAKSIFLMD